jgi:iron(III) transport system substrate-binding protein
MRRLVMGSLAVGRLLPFVMLALVPASLTIPAAAQQAAGEPLNVYTTREKALVEPMLRLFEALSRVTVNIVYLTDDPVVRLKADAAAGKADLFIGADLSQLIAAKAEGLTEPVNNADLIARVPDAYRDDDGHWFGLTRRLRVIATARDRVKQTALTYEELADPAWKAKICMRSGLHPDNVMLVASMIAHKGEPTAEAWLRRVKANLAGKPAGSDREQVLNVQAGRCDVALVNTSSVGDLRAAKDTPELQAAGNAVDIVFPNASDRGAHAGISGMAVIKDAPGLNNAALLMDFLTSEPAQFSYAQEAHEYPIRPEVKLSGLVESWGKPKVDEIALDDLAKLLPQAEAMIKKVGFDNGPGT